MKVFLNAAKGEPATKKDLGVFEKDDEEEAVCTILMNGELQVCPRNSWLWTWCVASKHAPSYSPWNLR